tara:strand:+ start:87 stop:1478 length:1392 start_codon:yes stop_codon:yes gene_type:complete
MATLSQRILKDKIDTKTRELETARKNVGNNPQRKANVKKLEKQLATLISKRTEMVPKTKQTAKKTLDVDIGDLLSGGGMAKTIRKSVSKLSPKYKRKTAKNPLAVDIQGKGSKPTSKVREQQKAEARKKATAAYRKKYLAKQKEEARLKRIKKPTKAQIRDLELVPGSGKTRKRRRLKPLEPQDSRVPVSRSPTDKEFRGIADMDAPGGGEKIKKERKLGRRKFKVGTQKRPLAEAIATTPRPPGRSPTDKEFRGIADMDTLTGGGKKITPKTTSKKQAPKRKRLTDAELKATVDTTGAFGPKNLKSTPKRKRLTDAELKATVDTTGAFGPKNLKSTPKRADEFLGTKTVKRAKKAAADKKFTAASKKLRDDPPRKTQIVFDDVEGYDTGTGRYSADTSTAKISLKDLLDSKNVVSDYEYEVDHKHGGKVIKKGMKKARIKKRTTKGRKRVALRGHRAELRGS